MDNKIIEQSKALNFIDKKVLLGNEMAMKTNKKGKMSSGGFKMPRLWR